MRKVSFDRPLTAAYSREVPTTIKQFDSTVVDDRIKAIRTAFTTLTQSIDSINAQLEQQQKEFQGKVKDIAYEIVKGFGLTDEALIIERLDAFIQHVLDQTTARNNLVIVLNEKTAKLLPQLTLIDAFEKYETVINNGLSDGECRAQFGNQGVYMSLNEQLGAIRSYLSKLEMKG